MDGSVSGGMGTPRLVTSMTTSVSVPSIRSSIDDRGSPWWTALPTRLASTWYIRSRSHTPVRSPRMSSAQRPIWMRQLRLADHLPADIGQIEARGIDRNAAAQAAPGQVEQLIDQPRCLHCAVRNPPHHHGLGLAQVFAQEQELRSHHDRVERVAKVVAHDPNELLAELTDLVEMRPFQRERRPDPRVPTRAIRPGPQPSTASGLITTRIPLNRPSHDERNSEETLRLRIEARREARDQRLTHRLVKVLGQRRIDAVRRAQSQQAIVVRLHEERPLRPEQIGGAVDRQLEHLVERRGIRDRAAHLGELPDLLQPVLLGSNGALHPRASTMRSPVVSIFSSRT